MLTDKGRELAKKVKESYNFFRDFTMMEEKSKIELSLWGDYLVMATLYNMADKVEVYWWEIAASVLSFLLVLTFKITPKGSMTKRKRKTLAVLYTAVPAIIPISLGVYGLFNHDEDILLSAMAIVVSVFLVVFRLNRASLVLNK